MGSQSVIAGMLPPWRLGNHCTTSCCLLEYRLPPPQMWTKLRPGLRAFLQRAAVSFELHICTMGDRDYAQQIAALLDPTRRLFAERIVSSVRWELWVQGLKSQIVALLDPTRRLSRSASSARCATV
jgi:NLI interacting factor-like phosphatase